MSNGITKVTKWHNPEKKVQTMLFDKTVLNKIKAYAIETDQSFDDVIKGPKDRFDADLLDLCREIDRIRQEAIIANSPKEPEQIPILE